MIYPNTFEKKIGFSEIRNLLKEHCISQLGKEQVDSMTFSYDAEVIGQRLQQVREFRRMQQEAEDFPLQYFFDMRQQVASGRRRAVRPDALAEHHSPDSEIPKEGER